MLYYSLAISNASDAISACRHRTISRKTMNIVPIAPFSPKVRPSIRGAARTLALAALACTLTACGPSRFVPSKSDAAWNGPEIWLESTPQWTVVAKAPTGGWTVTLDQLMEQRGRTEVFVTLKRPNPTFLVTAAEVEQRVITPHKNNIPVWVYARIQNFKGEPKDGSFSLAAKSQDAKAPPAPPEKPTQPADE
jgi:hypothetical protein